MPGVSYSQDPAPAAQSGRSNALGFLNLFSGGALSRLAIFGLGVMPYITSSIIIQLLTSVIPSSRSGATRARSARSGSPRPPGT